MYLDINQFKENFQRNNEVLLDRNLLLEDMASLLNYFRDNPNDCPDYLKKFIENETSQLTDFSLAYLGNILGKHLGYTTTEDGWVKLFEIK